VRPIPEITGADRVFGKVDHLPPYAEIPKEFKDWNDESKWNVIISRWFFQGLPKDTRFYPKPGVDPKAALAAIGAIMASFAPKHEHKVAGCAYLLSEWFDDVKVPKGGAA
jgi:hypothetical protein